MDDPRYKEILEDLYVRLLHEIKMRDQWIRLEHWENVNKYQNRAEAILDILENVTVFSIGLGAYMSSSNFKQRVASFKFLKVK